MDLCQTSSSLQRCSLVRGVVCVRRGFVFVFFLAMMVLLEVVCTLNIVRGFLVTMVLCGGYPGYKLSFKFGI